jgi:hypothetical protein
MRADVGTDVGAMQSSNGRLILQPQCGISAPLRQGWPKGD